MGNDLQVKEERRMKDEEVMKRFVKRLNDGNTPDLSVNKSIVRFTGLSSSDNLRQHYENRKREAGGSADDVIKQHGADWIKSLVDKLGDLTPAPALAGLGALAIAIFIDSVSVAPSESTEDALRSVFAEEKASEVWDHIDECLKRCEMHIHSDHELAADIRRIEAQLSAALTRLKNSMVRDGHMSPQALKAWVNGAAFHVQMLIHLVRLGGAQTCDPVERLIETYLRDLDTLFKEHRGMIEGKYRVRPEFRFVWISLVIQLFGPRAPNSFFLVDDDSNTEYFISSYSINSDECVEAYYYNRFTRQKEDIERYFSGVRQNLQKLVKQRGYFKL